MIGMTFANHIKARRKEKKLTLMQLARMTGLSDSYLSLIENSKKTPSLTSTIVLLNALELDPSVIFGDAEYSEQLHKLVALRGGKPRIAEGEETTTELIQQWARDRNLHTADPTKQMLKLGEEYGELCSGLAKNNHDETVDAIGDIYVVLTILAMQLNLSLEVCVDMAYAQIKDRKGKMVNGVFVKESDL